MIGRAWGGTEYCSGKRMILEDFTETVAPKQPEGGGGASHRDVLGERAPSKGKNRDVGHPWNVQGPARKPVWLVEGG